MPFIKSTTSKYYTLLAVSISLNREIISPYSYYIKKGLVCIIIIFLASRQPSSCLDCIKANTHSSCDMHLVSFNKYRFPYYARRYTY